MGQVYIGVRYIGLRRLLNGQNVLIRILNDGFLKTADIDVGGVSAITTIRNLNSIILVVR